jgi:hypothetical protein
MREAANAMADFIRKFPQGRVFVSTDDSAVDPKTREVRSKGVKQELKSMFGEAICFTDPRSLDRNTPEAIQDGLVDLLLLRETDYFFGTRGSSFSEFAVLSRRIPFVLYPMKTGLARYSGRIRSFLKRHVPQSIR